MAGHAELREETGLITLPERGRVVHSFRKDHYFCDVWLFQYDFRPEEILQLRRDGLLVPYGYMEDFTHMMQE